MPADHRLAKRDCPVYRVHVAKLGKIVVTNEHRRLFQREVGRRSQQTVTSVELDFAFPPNVSLETTCERLTRGPSNMSRTLG